MARIHSAYQDASAPDEQQLEIPSSAAATSAAVSAIRVDEAKRLEFLRALDDFKRYERNWHNRGQRVVCDAPVAADVAQVAPCPPVRVLVALLNIPSTGKLRAQQAEADVVKRWPADPEPCGA
ncbi:hypothetical protein ON010_g10634 [Phytophthora cinnamomi]|nr:hypothetical protein ON010_g10634 [Phytophthora cinnamomi]